MIRKELTVSSYEVDPSSVIRPSALLRQMQQAAREDLDSFGMTYPQMRSNGVVFVLYGIRMAIRSPLKAADNYTLETYSIGVHGASFQRDFYVYKDKNEVMRATSKWVLIDFEKRSIVHPSRLGVTLPDYADKDSGLVLDKRIQPESLDFCMERTVYPSLLDENEHLNNCNYADLVTDCLPYDKTKFVSELEILFVHEAARGDILSLSVAENDGYSAVCAQNLTKNNQCFTALSKLETKKG